MERTGNITFSVIVPVYNVQAYLSACVKSVVEQPGGLGVHPGGRWLHGCLPRHV